MAPDQECVDYARECIHLAELTKDLQLRDLLLTTAREWMATASKTKRSRAGIAASVGRPRYLNLPCRIRVIRDQAGRSHSVMRFRFAPKADAMTHPHPAALVARTGFIPSKS